MAKRPSKSTADAAAARLTVLIDEVPTQDDVFKVTPARFAAAAAGLKCTRLGGSAAAPQRGEVEALLAAR